MSLDQYQRIQDTVANPRDHEYRAFSKVTAKLLAAIEEGQGDLKLLNNAVDENRRLWLALSQDCSSTDNLLPLETRATIINLSRWVGQYSREVLRTGETPEPLIEVNRIMMDGLAGRAPEVV